MTAQVSDYTNLIVPEHQDKPKYFQVISLHAQAAIDSNNLVASFPTLFDLDYAVGEQLDFTGQWIGRTRFLPVPLPNVYFTWGVAGLGWGQGLWYQPFNPTTGLVRLPDEPYRTLLRATVAANQWDGTIPGAYTAFDTVFQPTGFKMLIQDYGDMSMALALIGPTLPDAITVALFTTGELDIKPAGVRILAHVTQTVPNNPLFGWGVDNSSIAGWGIGAWGNASFAE